MPPIPSSILFLLFTLRKNTEVWGQPPHPPRGDRSSSPRGWAESCALSTKHGPLDPDTSLLLLLLLFVVRCSCCCRVLLLIIMLTDCWINRKQLKKKVIIKRSGGQSVGRNTREPCYSIWYFPCPISLYRYAYLLIILSDSRFRKLRAYTIGKPTTSART